MTDPSNSRNGEKDVPEDADGADPIDDELGTSEPDVDDGADAADFEEDADIDDDEDDERPARDKPAATGKASRSGNPARAAEAEQTGRSTRPVRPQRIGNRWAAPAMLTSAAIGLIWIVLYYVFANSDNPIPVMDDLGDWNLIIGMGFIVAAFGFSMKWE